MRNPKNKNRMYWTRITKKIKRHANVLLLAMLIATGFESKCQLSANDIRNEMNLINNKYDSAFYLTFDIKMIYQKDTLLGNPLGVDSLQQEENVTEMTGTYTFSGNKALYKLGNIEYLQNERYTIALYKDNKFILVGKSVPGQKTGILVPTRALTDSMLNQLETQYYIGASIDSVANTRTLIFTAIDTAAEYEKIEVAYDVDSHYLTRIQYRVKDNQEATDEDEPIPDGQTLLTRKADLIFLFKNYRVDKIGPAVFDEMNYLFFDGPNEIKPASAYKDYTIYKNY